MRRERRLRVGGMNVLAGVVPLLLMGMSVFAGETGVKKDLRARSISPRIIGGVDAQASQGGWMAALVYSDEMDNFEAQFCGGTVIHPQWVLTAGHCVDFLLDPSEVSVVVGTRDLRSGGVRLAVDRIVIHPDYNDISLDSDIALLHLAEPVPESVPLMPIIENAGHATPGTIGTVLGWGLTSNGPDAVGSPTLLITTVPILTNGVANRPDIHDGALTENMLAAGQVLGGKDTCQGDSGGPLLVREPLSNRFVLAGITSFGPASKGCGDPDGLGAYTRVSRFRSWIYGYVFPDYLSWESTHSVTGENRDPDRDGATNWAEYVALTNPRSQASSPRIVPFIHVTDQGEEFPAVTFPRRSDFESIGVIHEVSVSSDLVSWSPLSMEEMLIGTVVDPMDPLRENVSIRGPLSRSEAGGVPAYFQVHSRQKRLNSNGGGGTDSEQLNFPGVANGQLLADTNADADGKRYADYQLANPPAGAQVSVALRSAAFNAELAIYNAETGALLFEDPLNSGGAGRDELIMFPVEAGVIYRIRVTTFGPNQFGDYSLRAFSLPVGAPLLLAGSTRNATLINSDPPDPQFLPFIYRKDDYIFRNTTFRDRVTTINMTSDAVDAYLTIIDTETGAIVAQNDDIDPFGNFNARVTFTAAPGVRYIVRATTGIEEQVGAYRLVVD